MLEALYQREKQQRVLVEQSANLSQDMIMTWISMINTWERDPKNAPSPYSQIEESKY